MNSLLEFSQVFISKTRDTKIYMVRDKKTEEFVGKIQWHSRWKEYCFESSVGTYWNKSRLEEVIEALDILNKGENNG